MDYEVTLGGATIEVAMDTASRRARVAERDYEVQATPYGNRVIVDVGGKSYSIEVVSGRLFVNGDEQPFSIARARPKGLARRSGAEGGKGAKVKPPMPGRIVSLEVVVGDHVVKGQGLFVLEAMKMQNEVTSPAEGLVKAIHCKPGETVDGNAVLVEIE